MYYIPLHFYYEDETALDDFDNSRVEGYFLAKEYKEARFKQSTVKLLALQEKLAQVNKDIESKKYMEAQVKLAQEKRVAESIKIQEKMSALQTKKAIEISALMRSAEAYGFKPEELTQHRLALFEKYYYAKTIISLTKQGFTEEEISNQINMARSHIRFIQAAWGYY